MTIPTEYWSTVRRDPSLVVYYRLNETIGTIATDYAGKYFLNGIYNGSPTNGPALINTEESSVRCGSKNFNGKTMNVEVPHAKQLKLGAGSNASSIHNDGASTGELNMALEAWVVIRHANATINIVQKSQENLIGSVAPYGLGLNEGKLRFGIGNGAEVQWIEIAKASVPLGVPIYMVGSYNEGILKLFLNEKEMASEAATIKPEDYGYPLFFGYNIESSAKAIAIAEVALYNAYPNVADALGAFTLNKALQHYRIGKRVLLNRPFYSTFDPPSFS